jgi:hypothetical protein
MAPMCEAYTACRTAAKRVAGKAPRSIRPERTQTYVRIECEQQRSMRPVLAS